MNVLKSFVVILVTGVLLLEVGKCNIMWSHKNLQSYSLSKTRPENDYGVCTDVVSEVVERYVPYTETYRTKIWDLWRIRTRQNFRREFQVVPKVVRKCCENFQKVGEYCQPICHPPCEKGYCIAPDVCVCNEGYQKTMAEVNTKCEPICANGCINGTCVEPNICSCNEGYWMSADGITCLPICDKECESNRGFCSEPHVCSCRSGYRKTGDNMCEPICERPCTNGHCVAPDVCKCTEGYEHNELDPNFACLPYCSEGCVSGTCTAPEICTCYIDYQAVNASFCEPICTKPCKMGVCVAPESCSCKDGYGLAADSKYNCKPICEFNCNNGACTAPGVCTCDEGFIYDSSTDTKGSCKPHCKIPCGLNGECTSPNNCTCFEGYRATPSNASSMFDNSTENSICQPVCDFECVNGKCTAPNECTCTEGYFPSWIKPRGSTLPLNNSTSRICEPICLLSVCEVNEICTAPNVCICKDGYEKHANGHCAPFCAEDCANGTCTEPNLCTCNSGFESRNGSTCEPVCERGCENGDCIGPNHCVCHNDFVKNTGYDFVAECIPACTRNCSGHGVCVIEDEYNCECNFGWREWDCEEPTMCVITLNFNHSDIGSIAIINSTDIATARALADAPYCDQCSGFLNYKSLCYAVRSDEANDTAPTVSCLLSTELPCYTTSHYNTSSDAAKITWPVACIAVLIVIGVTMAVYLMYRRQQKDRLTTGNSTAHLVRDSSVTESISCENPTFT